MPVNGSADSRVCREHADESLREVALTAAAVENWEEYGTVFIGYPIWWGIAAWPVDGFVTGNDFTGKYSFKVSPFLFEPTYNDNFVYGYSGKGDE